MKKFLTIFVALTLFVGVPAIVAVNNGVKDDLKITVEQVFGVMPDEYIGSFGLSRANTVESDYHVGYYYPMCGMKVTANEELLVADTAYGRIHVMSTDLSHKQVFGKLGHGDNQFQYPVDIAEDKDGNIYISDMFNNSISKFDSRFTFQGRFGSEGLENGQFIASAGLAVGSDGNIMVSDGHTARLQVFDSAMKFKQMGNQSQGDIAPLETPGVIRIGSNGNFFVAEMKTGRIFEFKPTGDYIKTAVKPEEGKEFKKLGAFDMDKEGNFYCLDRGAETENVRVFGSDGKEKFAFSVTGKNDYCDGIAVGKDTLFVHVYGRTNPASREDFENPFLAPSGQKLVKCDLKGKKISEKQYDPNQTGRTPDLVSVAVTSDGTIYGCSDIAVSKDNKVASFVTVWDKSGSQVRTIEPTSIGLPENARFVSVTCDSYDNIFFAIKEGLQGGEGYVVRLESGSGSKNVEKIGADDLSDPIALAVDRMDNLYVGDRVKQNVTIYTSKGKRRDEIAINSAVNGVAVDPFRNIACVTDQSVIVVDKKGRDIGSMGGQGRKPGNVYFPYGVVFANNGAIIISDSENGRIQIFDRKEGADYELVYSSPRMFYTAQQIFWGNDKKLYLADNFHGVIYKLNIPGYAPSGYGESGPEPPLPPQPPAPISIASDGEISVTPADGKFQLGAMVELEVKIKYASNIYGVGMKLKYDSSIVNLEKCEAGAFLSTDGNRNLFIYKEEPKGTVIIAGPTRTTQVSGMNGEGTLIKLTFSAKKEGESKIELSDLVVKDPDLNNIQVEVKSGKVKILPADSTPPVVNLTLPKGVFDSTLPLKGTTEKDAKLKVKIGTQSIDIKVGADGSFMQNVILQPGTNTIVITATDPAGNSKDYTYTVTLAVRNIVTMWIGKKNYIRNGNAELLNAEPMVIGGSTYVPMRDLGKALNCDVAWDAATKKATYTYVDVITSTKIVLEAYIDKQIGKLNGQNFDFGKAPKIVGGKTLVPLRAISQGLGADVKYEASSKMITITHPKP
jgi:sugar lactone lactonase YvrE